MYAPYQPPVLAPASHNLTGTPAPGHTGPGQGQGQGPLLQHQVSNYLNMRIVYFHLHEKSHRDLVDIYFVRSDLHSCTVPT